MRRRRVILKRTVFAGVTIFTAVTLNFILFRAAPGSPVDTFARVPNSGPELRAELRREFGLEKSLARQYVRYLEELVQGNLGVSYANSRPVTANLQQALVNTIPMVTLATVFAIVVGVCGGVVAAWRRGTAVDIATVGTAVWFYSIPTQWLGILLIVLFAGHLPAGGMSDPFLKYTEPGLLPHIWDVGKHMILPAATLGLGLHGQFTLITRSAMLETLGEDYILTARAKGLPTRRVVWRHAARNALLPVSTVIGLSLGYIVGGAILVEAVFSWPGIGSAVVEAVGARDYPMLQGAFLVLTLSVVLANYVVDLIYVHLDPRITE